MRRRTNIFKKAIDRADTRPDGGYSCNNISFAIYFSGRKTNPEGLFYATLIKHALVESCQTLNKEKFKLNNLERLKETRMMFLALADTLWHDKEFITVEEKYAEED